VSAAVSPNYRPAVLFSTSPQKIKTIGWKVEARNQTLNLKSASLTSHTSLTFETAFEMFIGKSEFPSAQIFFFLTMLCFKVVCMSLRYGGGLTFCLEIQAGHRNNERSSTGTQP